MEVSVILTVRVEPRPSVQTSARTMISTGWEVSMNKSFLSHPRPYLMDEFWLLRQGGFTGRVIR